MLRSNKLASLRWLALGLCAHGLAAALVLSSVLSSSTERGPAPARAARAHPAPVLPASGVEPGPAAGREAAQSSPDSLAAALEAARD